MFLLFGFIILSRSPTALEQESETRHEITLDKAGGLSVELFTQSVLEEAYGALDVKVRYAETPLARSYIEANSGRLDGLRGRVGTVANTYPNLIKVDVPLVTFNVILIVDKEACQLVTHEAEKECDINQLSLVGTVRGFKALEDYRDKNPLPFDVLELTSKEQTLDMLAAGKLQAVILTESLVSEALFEQNLHWSNYLLTTVSLYHYLNHKHTILARDVTAVLEAFEQSGWLEEQRIHHKLNIKSLAKSIPE